MNDEEVLREIAYLDDGPSEKSGSFAPSELMEMVRDAIQSEMAKQGHLQKAEDLSARVAFLDKRVEMMRCEFIRQRGTPSVTYVHSRPSVIGSPAEAKLPTAMIAFYSLGLVCSLAFATLLALSAVKVETIHPFISLLGLIGGLGWLTTAWTDLLLWKRENPSATNTTTPKALTASSTR